MSFGLFVFRIPPVNIGTAVCAADVIVFIVPHGSVSATKIYLFAYLAR